MEIKEILKKEGKFLKRATRILENVKVLYWKDNNQEKIVDITSEENKDLYERIELRYQIGELNKQINFYLVDHLRRFGEDPKPYMRKYWDEIVSGFGNTKNTYKTKNSFNETFLTNPNSPLHRKFSECLTKESMQAYIVYLKTYLAHLSEMSHNQAIQETLDTFKDNNNMVARYTQPTLPENWSEIHKQLHQLSMREKMFEEQEM